jgi:hypothetical protein
MDSTIIYGSVVGKALDKVKEKELNRLQEMAWLCNPRKGNFFSSWIGGGPDENTSSGGLSEHNPPHIHVEIKNKTLSNGKPFRTRIRIDSEEIPSFDKLSYVENDAHLTKKEAKGIADWLKEPYGKYNSVWEYARWYWKENLQDNANEGQTNQIKLK